MIKTENRRGFLGKFAGFLAGSLFLTWEAEAQARKISEKEARGIYNALHTTKVGEVTPAQTVSLYVQDLNQLRERKSEIPCFKNSLERNLVLAMIARESGSKRDRKGAFVTDPLQVANTNTIEAILDGKTPDSKIVKVIDSYVPTRLKDVKKTPLNKGKPDYSKQDHKYISFDQGVHTGVVWLARKAAELGRKTVGAGEVKEYVIGTNKDDKKGLGVMSGVFFTSFYLGSIYGSIQIVDNYNKEIQINFIKKFKF